MKHYIDPKITVKEAMKAANGKQSKLADWLGINRVSVHTWVHSGRKYLPPLQAYRFQQIKNSNNLHAVEGQDV